MEEKVFASETVIEEARASVELQFGGLLRNLPGIKGVYELVFIWTE
jgi:hypothetical protein